MRTRLYGGDVTVCHTRKDEPEFRKAQSGNRINMTARVLFFPYTHMSLFLSKEDDSGHIGEVNSPEGFMEYFHLR